MSVKIKGSLPKEKAENGLGDEARDVILATPRKPVVVIAVLQTVEITQSLASLESSPVLRIDRIEQITDPSEASALIERARELSAVRTGDAPLPKPEENNDVEESHPLDESIPVIGRRKGKGA